MYEKISEQYLRQAKIDALREKVLIEIADRLEMNKGELRAAALEEGLFEELIGECFALNILKHFVSRKNLFLQC